MSNTPATAPTTVCHLHSCQSPDVAYCQEQATDMVDMVTGTLELCQHHALYAVREYDAEMIAPIPYLPARA